MDTLLEGGEGERKSAAAPRRSGHVQVNANVNPSSSGSRESINCPVGSGDRRGRSQKNPPRQRGLCFCLFAIGPFAREKRKRRRIKWRKKEDGEREICE